MREPPRFSIIVPAYRAAVTLGETLHAIRAQAFADWECVIVDDGSDDGTSDIAEAAAAEDRRFIPVRQANTGTGGAYNRGVAKASGEFVVMCSADDVLLPAHLSRLDAAIDEDPAFDIYSSNGFYWRPPEERELVYQGDPRPPGSWSLADVIKVCFYSVGAAYRRTWFDRIGGYRTDIFGEDYDFWLRAMATGARHRYIDEPLSLFRISASQKSSKLESMYLSDIRLYQDLDREFQLGPAERAAVRASIEHREHLIRSLRDPKARLLRRLLEPAAVRLVGRARARRAWHRVRTLVDRGSGE